MKIFAHISVLSLTFISMLAMFTAAVIAVVAAISFVLWTIPPVPTPEVLYFSLRVLAALSTMVTIAYSFSNDYKETVHEYLSK